MKGAASALWVIAGLVAGIGLGIRASTSESPLLLSIVRFVEPIGTVFVNAIRTSERARPGARSKGCTLKFEGIAA